MNWDQSGYGAHTEKAVSGPSRLVLRRGLAGLLLHLSAADQPDHAANQAQVRWLVEGGSPVVQELTCSRCRVSRSIRANVPLRNTSFGIEVTFQTRRALPSARCTSARRPTRCGRAGTSRPASPRRRSSGSSPRARRGPSSRRSSWSRTRTPDAALTFTYFTSAGQMVTRDEERARQRASDGQPRNRGRGGAGQRGGGDARASTNSVPWWSSARSTWPNAPRVVRGAQQLRRHAGGRVGGWPRARSGRSTRRRPTSCWPTRTAAATVTIDFLREPTRRSRRPSPAGQLALQRVGGTGDSVPELGEERFGAVVTSADRRRARALLNANGVVWSAGTNATATRAAVTDRVDLLADVRRRRRLGR